MEVIYRKREQGDKASLIVLTLISNSIRCYPEMYVSVYYEFSLHRSFSPYWVNLVKFSVEMEFGL